MLCVILSAAFCSCPNPAFIVLTSQYICQIATAACKRNACMHVCIITFQINKIILNNFTSTLYVILQIHLCLFWQRQRCKTNESINIGWMWMWMWTCSSKKNYKYIYDGMVWLNSRFPLWISVGRIHHLCWPIPCDAIDQQNTLQSLFPFSFSHISDSSTKHASNHKALAAVLPHI